MTVLQPKLSLKGTTLPVSPLKVFSYHLYFSQNIEHPDPQNNKSLALFMLIWTTICEHVSVTVQSQWNKREPKKQRTASMIWRLRGTLPASIPGRGTKSSAQTQGLVLGARQVTGD